MKDDWDLKINDQCPFCKDIAKAVIGFGGIAFYECSCGAIVSFKGKESMIETKRAYNSRPTKNKEEQSDVSNDARPYHQ